MAQSETVEIVEVCRVAPPPYHSESNNTSPKSLPLSFFDIRWLRFSPPQLLYFYEIPTPNCPKDSFFASILPRLKHSMSLTLQHFLPLAGNLTWPPTSAKPILAYTRGDAVSLIVAKSYSDFYRLSSTKDIALCEAAAYRPLVPNLPSGSLLEAAAALAIQVTFFPNHSGFSIGITVHKAVLDGQSFFLFVKSWAHLCRSLGSGDHGDDDQSPFCLPLGLKPVYDRTTLFTDELRKLEAIYSSDWLNSDGPNNRSVAPWEHKTVERASIRGKFRLSRANIQDLKRLVLSNFGDHSLRVSTFSLVCAYTWVCLAKAEEISDEKVNLVFLVDCRSRLDPPLPATYIGNCVAPLFVVVEREVLFGKQGFSVAINAISKAMKSLANKSVLEGAENWVSIVLGAMHQSNKMTRKVYSVASSPKFEVYNTDFGCGRPRKVEVVSIDGTGAMSFSDNRNGDGVEIGVVLKKHQMEAFASLFAQGLEFGSHKNCTSTRNSSSL